VEKAFDPKAVESKWCQIWEQGGYYAPNPEAPNQPYCIMIPPPNVTGSLHMGHAFQDTIMDALIRFHRMRGYKTLWQVGTDHAGIATQMVVERQLQEKGTSRHDLGREAFVKKIWEWKKESGDTITKQLRRLGASVDWSRERFTMDPGLSAAVQATFVQLYREGLIYRGQRLVNWDPVLHTAISDLEVVTAEEPGSLWHIRYPIQNSSEFIIVATTRPETMLGDTAVAVHPEDPRYKKLIGKSVCLPLTDRLIPIIADDYVDPAFGSGCVKITPAHDFNDYAVGERHKLAKINIFTIDAKINGNAPQKYQGMDRFDARKQIIQDLTAAELLEKIEQHTLKLPRGDRSHSVVEPYLTDQWFVKIQPLAEPAIKAVESGEISFIPENWTKTYFEWMNNIQDWCISRQLWWGHRIPAWYDASGNIYVGSDEADVRQHYKLADSLSLKQDEDVLDTWFSSALWPFSTLGWPDKTKELEDYYPTNVLVTGFDIIFFWVARMIMFGLKFTGKIPFKQVYIHGLIQDQNGQKMSKSKGNIIDPLDIVDGISLDKLIEKRTRGLMQPQMAQKITQDTKKQFPEGIPSYGTDALRFTFCSLATNGRHLRFDLARLESYRNFCTKLWNAARYVFMNTEQADLKAKTANLADKWILSRWQNTKEQFVEHFDAYRFDLAAQAIYEFTWNEYCDWYLELCKPILNNPDTTQEKQQSCRATLKLVLGEILQVLHPIMPFITEEIWEMIDPNNHLITHDFPLSNINLIEPEIETTVKQLQDIILVVRNIRGEMNISPNKTLTMLIANASTNEQALITKHQELLCSLAKLSSITWLQASDQPPAAATGLAGNLQILIPMQGLIDKDAEISRLNKEIEKIAKDLNKTQEKLSNQAYVTKAPTEVVAKEQQRVIELQNGLKNLEQSLKKVRSLQ
jgi:valyl-tRNA synthetase